MRRFAVPAALAVAAAAPAARSDDQDPAAYLVAAHAKHADAIARGVTSFTARVRLRRADDENVERVRDQAAFTYAFTAPDREEFDFKDTLELLRTPLRTSLSGLWREATGALVFPYLDGSADLALERGSPLSKLTGTSKVGGAFTASFDAATGGLADATFADQVTRAWTCEASPKGLRPLRMDVSVRGTPAYSAEYDVHRDVSGHALPTVVRLTANGRTTEFHLEYLRLNDRPAHAEPLDPAAVKAKLDEMEKTWKGLDDAGKVERMREAADMELDAAAVWIAKLGLRDASPRVREEAAATLGRMKRPAVVPALVAALGANEKEIRVYLRVIEALGEIGDPRAVDPLSKDWWNQRVGEYGVAAANAKIAALGKIRDASSVDALLDTFTLTSEDRLTGIRPNIVASLKKLTGQDFLYDRKAWNDWWKRNRAGFRF